MPILQKKRIILAKPESTYGTDAGPTGAANAILVRSLDITPLDADTVSRDVVRPFLGSQGALIAGQKVGVTMEVEIAGSGTAGSVPAYGPLLRACGNAEVINSAAVTGTAQDGGSTTSIKLAAAASVTDNAYLGMPIVLTAGTGNGQKGTIIAYNGATKVATVAPAWASAPDATSGYSINACVVYRPISASFESATIYAQLQDAATANSPTHKVTGCRGNVELTFTAKGIPALKFTMTGIYNAPVDAAQIAAVYTPFKVPVPVNKANTPTFAINGYTAPATEITFNLNNEVVYRNLIGSESVLLTNRDGKGNATFEAPTLTQHDFFADAISSALGTLILTHGTVAGNTVDVGSGSINTLNPGYAEADGVVMMSLPFELVAQIGGDEAFFTVR